MTALARTVQTKPHSLILSGKDHARHALMQGFFYWASATVLETLMLGLSKSFLNSNTNIDNDNNTNDNTSSRDNNNRM